MPLRYPPRWYSFPRRSSRRAKCKAFVLLFLSWFFNVTTCADVQPASSWNPLGHNSTPQKRRLYDISVQQRHALIKWAPRIVTSRPDTVLKSLIVKVEGPETITRAEDLTLTTTITNTGSETLRLVNEPSGVLYSCLPTKRFYVTHSTGTIPQFKGVQVKFSLRKAIELGDITSLLPGQSTSVVHDLSEAYDFTVTGFGHYNFKPRNRFFVVNPATRRVTMVQAGSIHETSVEWSGKLVARGTDINEPLTHVTFHDGNRCSEEQKEDLEKYTQEIVDRVVKAQDYVYKKLRYGWRTFPEHFVPWFGEPNDTHRNAVANNLIGILEFNAHYDCEGRLSVLDGSLPFRSSLHNRTVARRDRSVGVCVDGGHFHITAEWLIVCPTFFKLENDAEIVSALISGLSRYNRFHGLDEYKTDEESCKELAKKDPMTAVENVHSFGFFLLEQFPARPTRKQQVMKT